MLQVDKLHAFYGKSHILNDATLHVRQGEIVALLGRNGAGKSTLLKTLAGLVRPVSGSMPYAQLMPSIMGSAYMNLPLTRSTT